MRLFVSVNLEALAAEVEDVQQELAPASGIRLTDPESTHVTLKFLGDTDPDQVSTLTDELAAAIAESDVDPFTAAITDLGVFPDIEYINVVWVGVREGAEPLRRLHEAIEERTTTMGFDPEDHDFTPHATIARMDHAGGKELVQETVRTLEPTLGTVSVEEIHLMESTLTEDGPEYSSVERFSLQG